MHRVLVTRRIPDAGLALLRSAGVELMVIEEDDEAAPTKDEILERIGTADALLSLLTEPVDREVLVAGRRLRGIANYAVGYDNVDVAAATELGIPVSNTPGILTETTADLTWALLLAVARRIPEADRYTREGRFRIWGPNLLLGADPSPGGTGERKVLGIVGWGRIGRAVARRAVGFDMDVLAYGRSKETIDAHPGVAWVDLDELVERADFLSLHVPLADETHHLIDESRLKRMKPTAYLINTARGPIVDEQALVRALTEGWIAGAGLDVYENEPRLAAGLAELDNVVLVPHIGSASGDTRDRMAVVAVENALSHLKGERAPNVVNPEVYESPVWRERIAAPPA